MSDLQRIKDEAHLINEPDHYWVIAEVERLQEENAKLRATLANIDAITSGLDQHRLERIAKREAIIAGMVVERKLITDDYTTLKALLLAIRGDAQAAHWHEDIDAALGGNREPT